MNGLGNICIKDRCNSPSTKAPTGKTLHPLPSLHPLAWTSLIHITHLHGPDEVSFGNFPLSVDTSPIGRPITSHKLALQICIMSFGTWLSKKGFIHMFNKIYDWMWLTLIWSMWLMIPWRVYLLMLQGHTWWTSTYGEMISLDLYRAKIPPDGCWDPNQGQR